MTQASIIDPTRPDMVYWGKSTSGKKNHRGYGISRSMNRRGKYFIWSFCGCEIDPDQAATGVDLGDDDDCKSCNRLYYFWLARKLRALKAEKRLPSDLVAAITQNLDSMSEADLRSAILELDSQLHAFEDELLRFTPPAALREVDASYRRKLERERQKAKSAS
ncbi:MAG TPA: hypothetical protein VG965_03040 [Patescibacteria group bacterium]|nr:hypothetical protein [Patescibacteria group bacterium]